MGLHLLVEKSEENYLSIKINYKFGFINVRIYNYFFKKNYTELAKSLLDIPQQWSAYKSYFNKIIFFVPENDCLPEKLICSLYKYIPDARSPKSILTW